MPATSIRDLTIHDNDLVVGTHGRSFWILDNFSLLRHLPAADKPVLFPPPVAYQLERNTNTDTPLPPDEPHGQNPPDGATLDYWLPEAAKSAALELVDPSGKVLRRFVSDDPAPVVPPESLTVMAEWARPFPRVDTSAGSHRFIWDLRGPRPEGTGARRGGGLPISAIWHETPFYPLGDWVPLGRYTVRLTIDGRVLEQPIDVRPDPRNAPTKNPAP
jgi:hypothetical protein